TSGRLGVLEAAECPPTFGTPPSRVQAIMAGGRASVFRSREGAEDDTRAGARAVRAGGRGGDVVGGGSASGVPPGGRGPRGAARLVAEIGAVPPARARRLLAAAGGRVPVAIVMARRDLPADAAARALRVAGSLRPVIERGGGEARFARR